MFGNCFFLLFFVSNFFFFYFWDYKTCLATQNGQNMKIFLKTQFVKEIENKQKTSFSQLLLKIWDLKPPPPPFFELPNKFFHLENRKLEKKKKSYQPYDLSLYQKTLPFQLKIMRWLFLVNFFLGDWFIKHHLAQ